ncbi:MAG: polyhydroxyalkanoate synthesis repressor PhaR [Aeromicrobium sp.]|nr:polyhydroxyalkanoate synthesis repressor PhaR [Burkholderiales bacterium]
MARIIKKYPNRRLYDTETSAYITLAEVKQFVLAHDIFQVQDARSGEDITRSILLQIILEEESGGIPMFSTDMLSNIIRYYGHSMQGLMGSYLERSISAFHEAQKKFQEQSSTIYGGVPNLRPDTWAQLIPSASTANPMGDFLEKSASSVIGMQEELRKQAMQMFSAFPYAAPVGGQSSSDSTSEPKTPPPSRGKSRRTK